MKLAPRTAGESPSLKTRSRLARLVAAVGESQAKNILGVSRHTLARILGGLSVHRGTIALVEQRLSRLRLDEMSEAKP